MSTKGWSKVYAKLSPEARAEIEAALGRKQRALIDLGKRKVLIQVIKDDEEFDLDAYLAARPDVVEELRQAISQADAGLVITHKEVKHRFGLADYAASGMAKAMIG